MNRVYPYSDYVFKQTSYAFDPFIAWSTIDTCYYTSYMTIPPMSSFQYTNGYFTTRFVGIYAQPSDATLIHFKGITAGIPLDVYVIMLLLWCALVMVFALIDYLRPSCRNGFN